MTDRHDDLTLPVLSSRRELFQTCRWRCGNQCFTGEANTSRNESFDSVLDRAVGRRGFLGVLAGFAGSLALAASGLEAFAPKASAAPHDYGIEFQPIALNTADQVIVPAGYGQGLVLKWGDPILPGAREFQADQQTAESQRMQFGYNCDYVSFMPLPAGSQVSRHGLMVVNHEYTNPELMFHDYDPKNPSAGHVDVEMAAHGLSVVEVRRQHDGSWSYVRSARNFRITAETPIAISGPAAGHRLLQTGADPSGRTVRGMLNNCAGGTTPWGTVLTCEENFHQYFAHLSELPVSDPRQQTHARYGLTKGATERLWERYHPRFDLTRETNEPFRFGWVVEVDPYDPDFTPVKRTALGRFKHEAATTVLSPDGRVTVYLGDDERFEYVYKFVSKHAFRPGDRRHNLTLLDEGTLYVARFKEDGTGEWLPLVHGHGPLTEAHGFADQGDVLINARGAADLLGATKMDRPEDIEANPITGLVYCVFTNNTSRTDAQVEAANPRPKNRHGHIIELMEEGNDPTATRFGWKIFMLCGDPANPEHQVYMAGFPADRISPISSPDNIAFDKRGNLWISTDGMPGALKQNDGLYVINTEGPMRGYLRPFLTVPVGAECSGPEFTPDSRSLFVSVQHPGEGGTLDKPTSTWPERTNMPRPAVVAVWRTGHGEPLIGA